MSGLSDRDLLEHLTDGLRDVRDTLTERIDTGFKGVHDRQDKTNGRVNSAHEMLREQSTKIRNLEREVFNRRATDRVPPPTAPVAEKLEGRFTLVSDRDVKVVATTLSAVGAVAFFVWKVIPFIRALLKAVP